MRCYLASIISSLYNITFPIYTVYILIIKTFSLINFCSDWRILLYYCTHYISLSLSYSHDIVVLYCTAAAAVVVAVATFFVVSLGSFLLLLLLLLFLRWRHYCIFCRDRTRTCSSCSFFIKFF